MTVRILIADDERAARFGMAKALAKLDAEITQAADGREALHAIRSSAFDLVFLDLNMPTLDGVGVLKALENEAKPEIIVVTASDSVRSAVDCMKLGAADFITKPYEVDQLRAVVRRTAHRIALESRVESLRDQLDDRRALGALVGVGEAMRELFRRMERAAVAPVDVLIRGETGTGKELIARELHRLSGRKGPFIAVNTAAVAESLAESELFGHVKGAFTGADSDRKGVFQQADGGTVFLDEIGDMPAAAQAKILRVLQERVVQPVGSTKTAPVDVRVVSATHQDLPQSIADGCFRQDLYYRIRGVELTVPPLRMRREDVVPLAEYFLQSLSTRTKSSSGAARHFRLAPEAVDRLLAWTWPGNVRELQQTIASAAAMSDSDVLGAMDFSGLAPPSGPTNEGLEVDQLSGLPLNEAKAQLVERFERQAIERALAKNAGNISAAARQLGMHRQSLQQKMDQLGVRRSS